MMFKRQVSLGILFFLFALGSLADPTTGITVSDNKGVGSFFAGTEVASLSSPSESLLGYGIQVGYQYTLTSRYAVDASLSQIYGSSEAGGSGLSALYSGIIASFRWAPWKEFSLRRSNILFEGRRIFEEVASNEGVYSVGVQMNQLFLNGTTTVYSASGLGAVGAYEDKLFGYAVRYEIRYALMSAANEDLNGLIFNLVTPF